MPGPTEGVDLWWSGKHGTTAATSKSSPPRTAGPRGPRRCGQVASTTPPPCASTENLPALAEAGSDLRTMQACQLVLLPRLDEAEIAVARSALRLAGPTVQMLQACPMAC